MYVYIYIYIYIYIYVCIYIYIYIYTHTHTHTHTYRRECARTLRARRNKGPANVFSSPRSRQASVCLCLCASVCVHSTPNFVPLHDIPCAYTTFSCTALCMTSSPSPYPHTQDRKHDARGCASGRRRRCWRRGRGCWGKGVGGTHSQKSPL